MSSVTAAPWHAAYPAPKSIVDTLSRGDLLQMFADGKKPGRDILLIDLRRTDHEGGTIRGSLNLPAQSLWQSLDTLYELCASAGVSLAIFYCGSSRGRGTRAAGWFQDICNAHGRANVKSVILLDGINGWARAGQEYVELMDGYVPHVWDSQN